MKLEHAAWLAMDIMPINAIDQASKILLKEVWRLQDKCGEPRVVPNIYTKEGEIDPEARKYP